MNLCVTAPSTTEQMEDNLEALDAGPLDEACYREAEGNGHTVRSRLGAQ